MKTINLFVDFEFTSLSPDAQPISVGIVSDEIWTGKDLCSNCGAYFDREINRCPKCGYIMFKGEFISKSFYAEFTDFDINRCDDWVKENVVGKLIHEGITDERNMSVNNTSFRNYTSNIGEYLKIWLSQFSDYEIQIIVDCGTWDFYWFLQLIAEWEKKEEVVIDDVMAYNADYSINKHENDLRIVLAAKGREIMNISESYPYFGSRISYINRIGLPKLPSNISPVPFDLNDLIAIKKGISPKEAFDLSRSWLFNNELSVYDDQQCVIGHKMVEYENAVHNAIWDAKVIKAIYNKLMNQ